MQVTHAADHITHAVIGSGKVATFGINDSPEFFRILSSTLYSDKKLAVVREILCNAWDAHIEHGCTDTAIQVTLTSEQLIIRDFGPGISPANILKNYTTYGGTTKIANDNVTGGFGLGSKAPFAYVDHFEVVSHHKGKKTIYRMSLSNAEVDGKPSVMTIMDLPTDETGVQVTIELKSPRDKDDFQTIIEKIARNGEMNVECNSYKLDTLPFSSAPFNYVILPKADIGGSGRIRIRYGHVIYPLSDNDGALAAETKFATEFLNYISSTRDSYSHSGTHEWVLVLYAQPGKISVTPSRETLSMTDQTIAECKRLLNDFRYSIREGLDSDAMKILEQAIADTWADGLPGTLCNPKKQFPNKSFFQNLSRDLPRAIYQLKDAARWFMCGLKYPKDPEFYRKDLMLRVQAMIDQLFGDEKLNKSYLAELKRLPSVKSHSNWVYRKVLAPLLMAVRQDNVVKEKNLFMVDYGLRRSTSYTKDYLLRPLTQIRLPEIRNALPLLRKFIILSHNRMDVIGGTDVGHYTLEKSWGDLRQALVYVVPRNPKTLQQTREFFRNLGFDVVDLTYRQTSVTDDPDYEKPASKPKPKGMPSLRSVFVCGELQMDNAAEEDCERLEFPEFYTVINANRVHLDSGFEDLFPGATKAIVRLFGDKGVVLTGRVQADRLAAKGVPDLKKYLLPILLKEYKTNKLIEQHYRNYSPYGWNPYRHDDAVQFVQAIRKDPVLRKKCKLPAPVSPRESDIIRIFESFPEENMRFSSTPPELVEIHKLRASWTISKALETLVERLKASSLIRLINVDEFDDILRRTDTSRPIVEQQKETARKLFLTALKG